MNILKFIRTKPAPANAPSEKPPYKVEVVITSEDRLALMRRTNTVMTDDDADRALISDLSWLRRRLVDQLINAIECAHYYSNYGLRYSSPERPEIVGALRDLLLDGKLPKYVRAK